MQSREEAGDTIVPWPFSMREKIQNTRGIRPIKQISRNKSGISK